MDTIVDRIYEAAILPELWPAVLADIGGIAEAEGAILIAARGAAATWLASERIAEHAAAYYNGGHAVGDERTLRLVRKAHPGFVVDYDVFTPDELEGDPVRNNFFRARGMGWGVATVITAPSGDMFVFHCERRFETGPVMHETARRLDLLRPHLARAALLSGRLDMMKATATVEALQIVDLPAAVLAHSGRIVAANDLMTRLIPGTVRDGRRMSLADAGADVLFAEALQRVARAAIPGAISSIALRSRGTLPHMVVHVVPVKGAGRDILVGSNCVVIVTPVTAGAGPSANLLQGLFDLTPAEAGVAGRVGAGMTAEEIAVANGTTLNTVRNQIKGVMQKTSCRRQTELALLMSALTPPSGQ